MPTLFDTSWTLFLDRDGVINERLPGAYVQDWSEFSFTPGCIEAMKTFASCFGRIVVVTNQQGVGKGLMSEEDLNGIHQEMCAQVEAGGGRIDRIYHCPDLKTQPGNCRKPAPAMAMAAQKDFSEINFDKSVMVGDSASDLEFGRRLGMQLVWIKGKEEDQAENAKYAVLAAYTHLAEFAAAIRLTGDSNKG